jgi:hypothetical protein
LRRFSGPDGIVPGDVGTFSAEDGFRKTFNIWDDLSLIRQSGKTAIDRAFLPPENDIACHEDKLQEGETVMEGAVSETTTSVSNGQRYEVDAYTVRPIIGPGAQLPHTLQAYVVV